VRALARPGVLIGVTLWLLAGLIWTIGSSHSSHTWAEPIPVPAASTNTFWAGYVATNGPYAHVQASWTVPAIPCSARSASNSTTYIWIGEGGYLEGLASPLIQAGTGSDCVSGMVRYHAFYEWYPGIYATDFPLDVRAGDQVSVRLQETQPDYWIVSFRDDTTGSSSVTATVFHADTGSADFIVERPTLCDATSCDQLALSRFGSVTFRDASVRGPDGHLAPPHSPLAIALVDPSGERELAVPARALSVLWRRGW
jgi:hypothetical protein